MKKLTLCTVLGLFFILLTHLATGQIAKKSTVSDARYLQYEGMLTDTSGEKVTGEYTVTFTIYEEAASTIPLWTEVHHIPVTEGHFAVTLGRKAPLPAGEGDSYSMGISIGGEELLPRQDVRLSGKSGLQLTGDFPRSRESFIFQDEDWNYWDNPPHMFALPEGNVGIGTTTPGAKLDVEVSGGGAATIGSSSNTATGNYAVALGYNTTAESNYSTAMGIDTYAGTNWYTTAMGYGSSATGHTATAMGDGTEASGSRSTALGYTTTASGDFSTSMGYRTIASGAHSLAVGREIEAQGDYSVAIALNDQDSAVVSQNNTMAIMGGKVGIGTTSPEWPLVVESPDHSAAYFASEDVDFDRGVLRAEFTGTGERDAPAVMGVSVPEDFWGIGGLFQGGYQGVMGTVAATGSDYYYGVSGHASGGSGINYGVYGHANGSYLNYGVFGDATVGAANYAGYFLGDVEVTGYLYKTGGGFKIDHPLDPSNKYLCHSFVESPDMKNVYDGVAVLDDLGEAWVDLPGWFETINGDFRYQLTAIGAPAPNLHIAEKISGNRFKIAGGEPGLEVSWQVTGIRQDAFAKANRIPVEEEKLDWDRGKYLHPEAFGLDESMGIGYAHRKAISK